MQMDTHQILRSMTKKLVYPQAANRTALFKNK